MSNGGRNDRPASTQRIHERYGGKYHIIGYDDHIELVPVVDNLPAAVRAAAGELQDVPSAEIRTDIEEEAKADARGTASDR
ncbi:AbrB/MazE/SpoVT family DNA-binding domain-containing protein [Halocatena pleomorpha]|uniref:AbrB/MazE/SpoVT family DNA-binding domain-containing protein n=1 Tax=Halocatena pleomorpha TaxID=1785090 RepID=A0A3P3RDG9_9EURY|nr:AbrB/MazE/SpoVT family DNA-binding domain-containing protein [Halocatena pleomorpha]